MDVKVTAPGARKNVFGYDHVYEHDHVHVGRVHNETIGRFFFAAIAELP